VAATIAQAMSRRYFAEAAFHFMSTYWHTKSYQLTGAVFDLAHETDSQVAD
jgi:hypothetical protein